MTARSCVYFMENETGSRIRIGSTETVGKNGKTRIDTHCGYGYRLLAIIPASAANEKSLHNFFEKSLIPVGNDRSHYEADVVRPYVDRLLAFSYAVSDASDLDKIGRSSYAIWGPKSINGPLMELDQGCLFVTPGLKAEIADTWQTPEEVVDICREALGGHIDLDPASCVIANETVQAENFYTERQNGLILKWHGKVFLNPPYSGEGGAEAFIVKLLHEIDCGRVDEGITVLNLQSVATIWFREMVIPRAKCHAIWNGRVAFVSPTTGKIAGKTSYSASQNGTIFSYFGENSDRFGKAFRNRAWCISSLLGAIHNDSDC